MNEPVYTLQLPRGVAMLAATLFRKLPLEQVEQPYGILMQQIEAAEMKLRAEEREKMIKELEEEANRKKEGDQVKP